MTSFVWELPIGETGSKVADFLVRNWQTNGIVMLRSGLPFNLLTGQDARLQAWARSVPT